MDLIAFQFNRHGGSFVVELAYADPRRTNLLFDRTTPVKKLRPSRTRERLRLGADDEHGDCWFSYEGPPPLSYVQGTPEALAAQVHELLWSQGSAWWDAQRERFA